jgi:sulfate transport system ATP-binding protein
MPCPYAKRAHERQLHETYSITHGRGRVRFVGGGRGRTARRVVVMNQARIEQTGVPEEVVHHPASEFVMDFMGNVNLFHGRIESGKAVFGPLVPEHSASSAVEGQTARLFVRPYDPDIQRLSDGKPSLRARVLRIQAAGPQVRVELQAETGEAVVVEMPHAQFRESGITPGDEVFVGLRDARVFTEDWSI